MGDLSANSTVEPSGTEGRQPARVRALPLPSGTRGVWVDDENAVVRRGMVASLLAEEIPVVGESCSFRPPPKLALISVLVFEADPPGTNVVFNGASRGQPQLVATLRRPTGRRLRELADAGVAGILLIDELTPVLLVHTIRSVASGRTTLSHALLMRLLDHVARTPDPETGALTPRERQVLQMLADGAETHSIAVGLSYSERTVKNIVHDVLTKLNCRTRAQAVGRAVRAGII